MNGRYLILLPILLLSACNAPIAGSDVCSKLPSDDRLLSTVKANVESGAKSILGVSCGPLGKMLPGSGATVFYVGGSGKWSEITAIYFQDNNRWALRQISQGSEHLYFVQ